MVEASPGLLAQEFPAVGRYLRRVVGFLVAWDTRSRRVVVVLIARDARGGSLCACPMNAGGVPVLVMGAERCPARKSSTHAPSLGRGGESSGDDARSFSEYVATSVQVIVDRAYPAYEFARIQTAGPSWSGAEGVR